MSFKPFSEPAPDVGVEVEFAGLSEDQTAEIAQARLGGKIERTDAHDRVLRDSTLGDVKIELDTALRKLDGVPLLDEGLAALRGIIPVEIVTEPLPPAAMPDIDALIDDLRKAGARGSRDGVLLGFGVHLNVSCDPENAAGIVDRVTAYALIEDWLRARAGIDGTRRALPFVDPWPEALIDDLVDDRPQTLAQLADLHARHVQSRNHGLDLLPLLAHAEPDRFDALYDGQSTSSRPAFHFRLPDCRIDEPDWSLQDPWDDWMAVEQLAADPAARDDLARTWRERSRGPLATRAAWAETVGSLWLPGAGAA